jgi:Zn-dependent protease with chaperone function
MSWTIEGRFFSPASARAVPALASVETGRVLRVCGEAGQVLAEAPARKVKVTARLARLTRRFDLPDGSRFETDNNDGADALLLMLRKWRRGRFTDKLEHAWPVVGLSLLITLAAGSYFIGQAVPVAAEWLALKIRPAVAHTMSEQALFALDRAVLRQTALPAAGQAKAAKLFARVAAHAKDGAAGYRLVFRAGGALGANAFALPDGTIVMTDQLWALVKNDAEIEGVFAHEMSHVDHAHQLQRVLEASMVPAGFAIFTGDMSQISQIGSVLPGLILQSAYSRRFESQADDDGAATLRRLGEKPSHMAEFLERLDRKACGPKGCPPSWIGDHPDTVARAARLRAEDAGPIRPPQDCWQPWKTGISLRCLGWN